MKKYKIQPKNWCHSVDILEFFYTFVLLQTINLTKSLKLQ